MAGFVTVEVFDTRIVGMFGTGKEADRFLATNLQQIRVLAIATCPVRRGAMKSRHGTGRGRVGPYAVRGSVYNDAPYAAAVHEGVNHRIYPHGDRLWLRPAPIGPFPYQKRFAKYGGRTPLESVAGQNAQPWIADAGRAVVARYI